MLIAVRRSPWWALNSISSGAWSELNGANLDVRQPESSSLDQPYLVASSGIGCVTKAFHHPVTYRYLWATFSLKESLVGGSDSCFGGLASVCQGLTIHLPLTRFINHCAWWIMLRPCLLVSKCVDPCTGFQCDNFAKSKVGCHCITASHIMRSQPARNTCNILLVLSYISWISITVEPWIGDIIITLFVRSALCMKCTDMMKTTVSFATTNDTLYLSLWYSCCIMIVLVS